MERPTIETGIGSTIRGVADQVARGAGLALLRGPAGIGKSFALDMVEAELKAAGVRVVRVTASTVIGGNVKAFAKAVLAPYGIEVQATQDAVDAMWGLLRGYPFQSFGDRVIFMVDEAQELKTVILETVHSGWDLGTAARLGDAGAPAFGCMFIGNNTFMGKGGSLRTAAFRPLLSRVTHNINLPRPGRSELAAHARQLAPEDGEKLTEPLELQTLLRDLGESEGQFRALATAMRVAGGLAGDGGAITPERLRLAIRMMRGR